MVKKLLTFTFLLLTSCSLTFSQQVEWTYHTGGSSFDIANDVTADKDGYSYATGWIKDTAVFGSTTLVSTGGQDFFLAKFDQNGSVVWAVQGGGPSGNDQGYGVDVDSAGNVYVTGSFEDTVMFGATTLNSTGLFDIFLAKYNSSGTLVWAVGVGSSQNDQANDIKVSDDGDVYITGNIQGPTMFGLGTLTPQGYDMFIARYNTFGTNVWARLGGGSGTDNAYGLAFDGVSRLWVTGPFEGTATFTSSNVISIGDDDIYVVEYDTNGSVIWAASGGSSGQDQGNFVSYDAGDNEVLVTGYFTGSTCTFGTTTIIGSGNSTAFIAKYDAAGMLSDADAYASTMSSQGAGIIADDFGNEYFFGQFSGSLTIDSASLTSNNPTSGWDVFLVKFDTLGVGSWGITGGGTSFWDTGNGLALDGDQNVFFGGTIQGTAYIGSDTLMSNGAQDMFIAKAKGDSAPVITERLIHTSNSMRDIVAFPNPAANSLQVQFANASFPSLTLHDLQGRIIKKLNVKGRSKISLDISDLPNGLYTLVGRSNDQLHSIKIIVER